MYQSETLQLNTKRFNDFLTNIAESLDIPDALYEEATLKYEEVAIWLSDDGGELAQYAPEIYAQGSFRLGTVVQPVTNNCEYDIDLVCRLDLAKESTTQKDLKTKIGDRLKANADLVKKLSSSRRCWNLTYPRQFHMDVLPSIANVEQPPDGILLTDTELHLWQKSNPKEYSDWFHRATVVQFQRIREDLAKSLNASIEEVPEWRVKTPLQRAVQILKRHRDLMFQHDLENRPVSIILTTLAARAYSDQTNVADALLKLAFDMPKYIENRDGKWWVANPVEPDENFADKWNEKPERRFAFLRWMDTVQKNVSEASKANTLMEASSVLSKKLGANAVSEAQTRYLTSLGVLTSSASTALVPLATVSSAVTHVQPLMWLLQPRYKAEIKGGLYPKISGKRIADLARRKIPKGMWLKFAVKTNTPWPYTIKWQVVNTGPEAALAGQLRGDYYDSTSTGSDVRWESTSYSGVHWVEAFIIKDGICVARSGRTHVVVA
jgi:hypothetical protein